MVLVSALQASLLQAPAQDWPDNTHNLVHDSLLLALSALRVQVWWAPASCSSVALLDALLMATAVLCSPGWTVRRALILRRHCRNVTAYPAYHQ